MMDRRGFLRFLGAGVAGIALEQAIPLGRVWSFPSWIWRPRPRLYNTTWIDRETLRILENNLQFAEFVRDYDPDFNRELRVGSTVRIRLPQQYIVRDAFSRPIPAFRQAGRRLTS